MQDLTDLTLRITQADLQTKLISNYSHMLGPLRCYSWSTASGTSIVLPVNSLAIWPTNGVCPHFVTASVK